MIEDESLCHQVWAVEALQNGRPDLAARCISIPREVVGARLGDQNHIPPWILESVVNARFALPAFQPQRLSGGRQRVMRTDTFASIHLVAGLLRAAEGAEQGVLLERLDVMKELPRLLQRQLEWSRGWLNGPQVYRWAYLYGSDATKAYFQATHGLSISDFILFGVMAANQFGLSPVRRRDFDLSDIGLSAAACEAALRRLVLPACGGREEVKRLRGPFAGDLYKPSLLRGHPILAFGSNGERLRAPLPDLIMARVTAGLFYDLAQAPTDLRNEAADRFETYVRDLLNTSLPGLESVKGEPYRVGKRVIDAPDVMVCAGGALAAVIECKARKMSFTARYGERPEDEVAVGELVKGVVQVWRHFAHDRLGLTPGAKADGDTVGMLLTLENWTQMNRALQVAILERARASADRDALITEADRRPIVFVSVEELETTLEPSDEAGFLRTLREARTERFTGWMLPNVFREVETGVSRPYPMAARLAEILPWWSLIEDAEGED